MARRQCHIIYFCWVPSRNKHTAGVWIVVQRVYNLLNLVDSSTFVVGPRPPLVSVDRTELTVFVCPFVPYSYTMFLQELHVCIAFQEP